MKPQHQLSLDKRDSNRNLMISSELPPAQYIQPTYQKPLQKDTQTILNSVYKGGNKEEMMKDSTGKKKNINDDEEEYGNYAFPDPHVAYKIMPAEDDKMSLDVTTIDEGDKLKKGNIIIWDYHGGPNQRFYLKRVSGSTFFIINAATGFTLEVPDESTEDEIQIHTNPRNNAKNEIWELVGCGKDLYKIKSFCGKVLDINHHFLTNGTPVIQFTDNNAKNQKWKIWPG